MKRVLISLKERNRLCDIVNPGQEFPVSLSYTWVDAPDDVAHGTHVYRNGAVVVTPPLSAEEVAEAAKRAEFAEARAATKSDAFVRQFVEMTPAQVIAYVNSNVANLADAKQLLTKLALMMLAIAKEQYK